MLTRLLPLFLLLFTLVACGNDAERSTDGMDQGSTSEKGSDMDPRNESEVTVTPMPPTAEFQNAAINDWTYDKGTFNYEVSNYEFGQQTPDAGQLMCANSGKGQHAHLIIDNEPYIAKYEPTFDQAISDGDHYILTFLSRSYHESIKTPAAHRAVKTTVASGAFSTPTDITEPMLFYSRPKGTYVGKEETENVMLDFYPVNLTVGEDGYEVQAMINGKPFMIQSWQPYYVKGLPLGDNEITLTLMKDGEIVDTPLNPVKRTFTLEADPAERTMR